MIIEFDFANDLLEKIEVELNNCEENNEIQLLKNFSVAKTANKDWMLKYQIFSFPIYSSTSTNTLSIYKEYYDLLVEDWKKNHPQLVEKGIEKTVQNLMDQDMLSDTIYSAIYDKVSKLVYQYGDVLKNTIETNGLFGIQDEEKILLIHLKKYQEILSSENKQIQIFHGVILNKSISDNILKIYTRFIKLRLDMLNPSLVETNEQKTKLPTKFIWKGSQKHLLELFVELRKNNWIDDLQWGDFTKSAKAICNLFDLSQTRKNDTSDIEQSFYQILKGKHNRITNEREYDDILGPEKNRKFNNLKKNGS